MFRNDLGTIWEVVFIFLHADIDGRIIHCGSLIYFLCILFFLSLLLFLLYIIMFDIAKSDLSPTQIPNFFRFFQGSESRRERSDGGREERSTKEEDESPDDFTEKNIQNKTPAEEDDEEEDQKEEEPIKIVRRPRRSSLQLPGKRRRSSMNIKEGGIKKGPRRMSSIEKRVRRLSLRRNSVNKGRRLSVRRMARYCEE